MRDRPYSPEYLRMISQVKLPSQPFVGETRAIHGIAYVVLKIHPAYTLDVQRVRDGKTFRITGLWWQS